MDCKIRQKLENQQSRLFQEKPRSKMEATNSLSPLRKFVTPSIIQKLENQQYRLVGGHSAVKICHWTKKSLLHRGFCYKQKFYGIESHRCCQMTPSLFCPNKCLYCWRSMEFFSGKKISGKISGPKEIIDRCIEQHRVLINGFPGNPKTNMEKFREAQNPTLFAISLSGEPAIYPKLGELIEELKKRKIKSFLVSNGLFPERIENLGTLPTQLYISLDAPTKQIYKKIDRPLLKDFWERLNRTLELLPSLNTRTVLRVTAVKGLNMTRPKEYAKLIEKAASKFLEVKGYMWVGESRERLKEENMPSHAEVREFASEIGRGIGYKIIDEKGESAAVLLAEKDRKDRFLG